MKKHSMLLIIGMLTSLALIVLGVMLFTSDNDDNYKRTSGTNLSSEKAPKNTDEKADNVLEIQEWGVSIRLLDEVSKSTVSYTYQTGSDDEGFNSRVNISNSEDPLVKECSYLSSTLTRMNEVQAKNIRTPTSSENDENYGAQFVQNGYYYFKSGPQQACKGDYSVFSDPQHKVYDEIM